MRYRSILFFALVEVLGLSGSPQVAKQVSSQVEIFREFSQSISTLREALRNFSLTGAEYEKATTHLVNMQRSLSGIEAAATRQRQAQIPDQFLPSLKGQSRLLNELASSALARKPEKARLMRILPEVDSDLEVKLSYSTSALGQALRLVQVIVHTKRNDREEQGYKVWYVPKALSENPDYYQQFDRLSSPTDMDIAPGNYFFWAEKEPLVSERKPVAIGSDRKSRKVVDILVP